MSANNWMRPTGNGDVLLLTDGFPVAFAFDVAAVSQKIPCCTTRGISNVSVDYLVGRETLRLPQRIYFQEISEAVLRKMTQQEK